MNKWLGLSIYFTIHHINELNTTKGHWLNCVHFAIFISWTDNNNNKRNDYYQRLLKVDGTFSLWWINYYYYLFFTSYRTQVTGWFSKKRMLLKWRGHWSYINRISHLSNKIPVINKFDTIRYVRWAPIRIVNLALKWSNNNTNKNNNNNVDALMPKNVGQIVCIICQN